MPSFSVAAVCCVAVLAGIGSLAKQCAKSGPDVTTGQASRSGAEAAAKSVPVEDTSRYANPGSTDQSVVAESASGASRTDANGTFTAAVVRGNANAEAAKKATTEHVTTFSVYAVIPRSRDEYYRVFLRNDGTVSAPLYSDKVKGTLESAERRLREIAANDNVRFADSSDNVAEFSRFLGSQRTEFVFVVGHNDNGAFRFPNGDNGRLTELAAMCERAAKQCIFLSCRSLGWVRGTSVGLGRDIGFDQASIVAARTAALLKRTATASLKNVRDELQIQVTDIEKEVASSGRVQIGVMYFSVTVSGAVGVALLIEIEPRS